MLVLLHRAFEDCVNCLVDEGVKARRHFDLFGIPRRRPYEELKLGEGLPCVLHWGSGTRAASPA